jgi:hypothetical protein
MIGVTITPNVTPGVYATLAVCLTSAIESAASGARAMQALGEADRCADYEQAMAIFETMQRIFERQGSPPS